MKELIIKVKSSKTTASLNDRISEGLLAFLLLAGIAVADPAERDASPTQPINKIAINPQAAYTFFG